MKRYRQFVIANVSSDQLAMTPLWLVDKLSTIFGITYDPCPAFPTTDGLNTPWHRNTYCNPPYRRIGKWLQKADLEWNTRQVTTVFLIPVRFYAKYTHSVMHCLSRVYFLTDLIKFQGYQKPLGIGLCLWVHGAALGLILPETPYRIGIVHVDKPYTLQTARRILDDSKISVTIVKARVTHFLTDAFQKWQQKPSETHGLIIQASTKLRVFRNIILPEASYIGFCNHLLKADVFASEFCMGSMIVVFGPKGGSLYDSIHNKFTINAGLFDSKVPRSGNKKTI